MAGVRRSNLERKNRRARSVWVRTALTAAACLALVLFAMRGFSPAERAESSVVRSQEAADVLPASGVQEAAAPETEETAAPTLTPTPAPVPAAVPKESGRKRSSARRTSVSSFPSQSAMWAGACFSWT